MKPIFILFLSFLALISCNKNHDAPSNSSATDSLKVGLIAYYPFNNNANDESGNQYNLSVHAALPDTDRFGNAGKAYYFDGITARMDIPDLLKSDTLREMTISFWVKQKAQGGDVLSFLPLIKGPIESNRVSVYVNSSDSNIYWFETIFLTSITDYQFTYSSSPSYFNKPASQWVYYVWIQHYTTQYQHPFYFYTHYQNNTKFNLQESSSQNDPSTVSLSHGGAVGCNVYWQPDDQVSYSHYFQGSIDDIRIYNRALSDEEVKKLYELKN